MILQCEAQTFICRDRRKKTSFDWRGSYFICILNFKGNVSAKKKIKMLVGPFIQGGFVTHEIC